MSGFKKATKAASKLRLGLIGPAGSGKTMTALRIARGLAGEGGRVAGMDTERGSMSLYAGERGLEFEVLELESYEVERFLEGLKLAAEAGVDVLVIDSLSHAWAGKGGILEFVDAAKKRGGGGIDAWGKATPLHNQLRDAILSAPFHVIATMRSKVEYVVEKDERTGKTAVRKVGLQPVQREGMEYEFDVVGDINAEHELVVTKTRALFLKDAIVREAGEDLGRQLRAWLDGGDAAPPRLKSAPAVNVAKLLTDTSRAIAKATEPQLAALLPKIRARQSAGELSADQAGMLIDQIDARRAALGELQIDRSESQEVAHAEG